MGSFSIWHWIIVLLVVAMVFGTKKLRNIGSDLGSAIKGFREGMGESSISDSNSTDRSEKINPDITQNNESERFKKIGEKR